MGSRGAEKAVLGGRGNRMTVETDQDFEIIMPNLPTGRVVLNTVFLHGDIRVRPFKVEDFRDALEKERLLSDVVALGAYQINHVWAVTMNSPEATKRLAQLKELQVKGRRCLVIDPQEQQVRLRLHWLLHGVADDDVRTALAAFGKVTEVTRERWRVQGVNEKNSTTRTALIKLNSGVKVDDLPHQIRVAGELALVVAPGRPMQCLRCKGAGHVRRECKVPQCSQCRRFGHVAAECVRSYAVVAGSKETEDAMEHIMDVTEAEDAAKGSGEGVASGSNCTAATVAGQVRPVETAARLDESTDDLARDASSQFSEKATPSAKQGGVSWDACLDFGLDSAAVDATGVPECAVRASGPAPERAGGVACNASSVGGSECSARDATGVSTSGGSSAAIKRPLEEPASQGDKKGTSNAEGPPAKTPAGRRTSLRPRPGGSTEKRVVENPPTGDNGPPGGPGGV